MPKKGIRQLRKYVSPVSREAVEYLPNGSVYDAFDLPFRNMLPRGSVFFKPNALELERDLLDLARVSLNFDLWFLEYTNDFGDYMERHCVFPAKLDWGQEVIARGGVLGGDVRLCDWNVVADVQDPNVNRRLVSLVGRICSGITQGSGGQGSGGQGGGEEPLRLERDVMGAICALADIPRQLLADALLGTAPAAPSGSSQCWVLRKVDATPGHSWSWVAALYMHLPAWFMEPLVAGAARGLTDEDVACASCRLRATRAPAPPLCFRSDLSKYYTRGGALGSSYFFRNLEAQDPDVPVVEVCPDYRAMRCVAGQARLVSVLSQRLGLSRGCVARMWADNGGMHYCFA